MSNVNPHNKRDERLGQIYINRHGTSYIVVEYNNTTSVVVEFMDEHKCRVHTNFYCVERGWVRNPFDKTVYGIGCYGVVEAKNVRREYTLWSDMLKRCYAVGKGAYLEKTYVCDRWLCFANFLEDLPLIENYSLWKENPKQGISLDKDVKGNGTRIYCLEHCCFLTLSENSKERDIRKPQKTRAVIGINIKTGETLYFPSTSSVIKHGFTRSAVTGVCNGVYKQHKGYKWYWEDEKYEN